jgi:hypothetical protein
MSLSKGRVNALNVLNMRKLDRIPPNFAKMKIKEIDKIREIDNWIYTNLDSRYCIRKIQAVDPHSNKLITAYEIGVEEPKELSMLSLACPYLHK